MTPPPWWAVDAYVLVVGACLGSFLNVVIARLPHGQSLLSPPSTCPRCQSHIAWYDNVPILSWLALRARCRSCRQPISARYPVVELLTALLLFAVWRRFGGQWATLGYAAFVCALIALTYIDLDTWLLPHEITWPLLAAGLLSPLWNPRLTWADSLIGAGAGFAFFAAIALVGEKLLRKETMGWGDVWLLSGIGAWLGWQALLPVVLFSAIQGS
ncbi:MAG TPA: prepilin peptidase, partial [Myxococcales bacterium]|nr:prepilin peptidase [Myxococcales bacterium]